MRLIRAVGHYIRHTDLYLLVLSLLCSSYGLLLIYSATRTYDTNRYLIVQFGAICLGIAGFVVASLIDVERFSGLWKFVFLFNILLQLSLFVIGSAEGGNRSWIRFGPIGLQPAEIGKLLFIFTFAAHISLVKDQLKSWKTVIVLGLHLLIIMGVIIVSSSDVGMSLSYLAIALIMMFAAGVQLRWFAGGAICCGIGIPVLWKILKDYQKERILVLFDPSINPEKAYQTTQSKIAIGAGEMYGKGYLQGNQTQYNMVPEKHTDFIFAVAGEEFGFIGCCVMIVLLLLLVMRLYYVSFKADTTFSAALCVGIAGMIFFQMFENIFMCLGLFPVMGLTLPFFSYGGTSVLTMYIAVGLVAGVRMREKPSWLQK